MAGYPVQRGHPRAITWEAVRRCLRDSGTLSGTSGKEERRREDPAAARTGYRHGPRRGRCLPVPARLVGGGCRRGSPRPFVGAQVIFVKQPEPVYVEPLPPQWISSPGRVGLDEDVHAVVGRPTQFGHGALASDCGSSTSRATSLEFRKPMPRRGACPVNKLPHVHSRVRVVGRTVLCDCGVTERSRVLALVPCMEV
jgi:hypothetical protein